MSRPLGKLLYRIPDKEYKRYKYYTLIGLIVFYSMVLFSVATLFVLGVIYKEYLGFICGLSVLGVVLLTILPSLNKNPIQRFEIYENGMKPPRVPLFNFLFMKEYVIHWDDIRDVKVEVWGFEINLTLKNGKKNIISSSDISDPIGYVLLLKRLQEIKPELKKLDIDTIKECKEAAKKLRAKEISNRVYDQLLEKCRRKNKEFAGAFGRYIEEHGQWERDLVKRFSGKRK